jgi:two-component sensor histidine kinase
VDVGWTLTTAEDHHEIVLDWIESGGPEVTAPQRRGFGTRLIERGIASDLKSEVNIEFRSCGLHCRFVARQSGDHS